MELAALNCIFGLMNLGMTIINYSKFQSDFEREKVTSTKHDTYYVFDKNSGNLVAIHRPNYWFDSMGELQPEPITPQA